ncbi:DUF3561 family protein [Klebsiella sp. BIGb0407]|uniref:DUF3561 family protein n=1 Tax=Klebsiella sp. BIGb0407 TaxID=2940603 RepID=UPI00216AA421|nr:DUF3561 family protein [Klebsiella sp. BIGb0407]MCS3434053.1 dolichyl-phosphate-mannose--protein O-mannosyl transferase [Klebsiella sp. BIGb0407]
MRNSSNYYISLADSRPTPEEKAWSVPGAFIGFLSWLLALGIPFLLYGLNTLFFFLYTWPFFLALMPLSVVIGVAMYSLSGAKLVFSALTTLVLVGLMFGVLLFWLLN